jgi:hypothetical protein
MSTDIKNSHDHAKVAKTDKPRRLENAKPTMVEVRLVETYILAAQHRFA